MPFPNLTLIGGGVLHSNATGTPANGVNTVLHNINPAYIDNPDWLVVDIIALGSSITGAGPATLSVDKTTLSIPFTQTGADQAKVSAKYIHSGVR